MKRGVVLTKKNKSNILANIVKSVLVLFFVLIIYNFFLLVFTAKTDKEAKYVFGYRAYVIITESMKPNLNTGDIIIIKKTNDDEIYLGDIITYKSSENSERITHRIVEKSEDIYITKGDNNKIEDKVMVRTEDIEGKYIFKIPFIGKMFLKVENMFYAFFLTIIILTIFLYNRRTFSKSEIRREKKEYADLLREERLKNIKEIKGIKEIQKNKEDGNEENSEELKED